MPVVILPTVDEFDRFFDETVWDVEAKTEGKKTKIKFKTFLCKWKGENFEEGLVCTPHEVEMTFSKDQVGPTSVHIRELD